MRIEKVAAGDGCRQFEAPPGQIETESTRVYGYDPTGARPAKASRASASGPLTQSSEES